MNSLWTAMVLLTLVCLSVVESAALTQKPRKRSLGPFDCDNNPQPQYKSILREGEARVCQCKKDVVAVAAQGGPMQAFEMCVCAPQIVVTNNPNAHECQYRSQCSHPDSKRRCQAAYADDRERPTWDGQSLPRYGVYRPGDIGG